MTQTAIKNKQIDEDINQRERERKQNRELKEKELKQERDLRGKELGAKYLSGVGSALKGFGAMANDPKWYTNAANDGIPSNTMATWYPVNTAFPISAGSATNMHVAEYVGFPFLNVFPKGFAPGSTVTIETGEAKLNFTAERLRAYISAKTGRAANYDPSDIMFILIASTDIIARMLNVNKLIRLLFYKNATRPELSKQILAAHGYDYEYEYPLRSNTIGEFNSLVQSINATLLLPKEFPYIARKALLAYGLWMDTKSNFHTVFDFISLDHLVWDEANSLINAEVITHATSTPFVSLSYEISKIADELKNITGSQLARDLYPDMRLAYLGKDNQLTDNVDELGKVFYTLNFLDLTCTPEFRDVEEFKEQLLNAEFMSGIDTASNSNYIKSIDLTDGSGNIQASLNHELAGYLSTVSGSVSTPFPRLHQDSSGFIVIDTKVYANTVNKAHVSVSGAHYINSYADEITEDDVVECSRLKSTWVYTNPATNVFEGHFYDGGTEVLYFGPIMGLCTPSRGYTLKLYSAFYGTAGTTEWDFIQAYLTLDYAPALTGCSYSGSLNLQRGQNLWIMEHVVPYPDINYSHFNITAMQSLFTPNNNLGKAKMGRSTYRK